MPFIEDFDGSTYDLSIYLKEYVEDYLIQDTKTGLAIDYALAFISDVNWYEIAESMESLKEEEIAA